MLSRFSPWRLALVLCLLVSFTGRTRGDATCPATCTCVEDSVTCSGSNLTVLPADIPDNETVRKLCVSRTQIKSLNATSFNSLTELVSVDLSNNLDLKHIADGSFASLTKLESLTLRRNAINQLTNETFIGLEQLTSLDLSYNCLTEIPDFAFHQLKSLQVLDLARNNIEIVTAQAFGGLKNVKTLNLTRNTLVYLDPEMFLPLVSLENLILEDCGVKIIPGKAFAPLVALKHLSLNGNPLDTFKPMAFWNESDETPRVVPLEDLSLKGTQLKELPVEMMKNLTQLRNLDLSNTSIETVGNASFSKLHDLVKLTVDSCRSLKQIETGAFTGLNKLQNLVITNNKVLGEIGWGAFKNLSSLKVLDLSGNNVEIFRASMADWEDIGLADLRFNPIRCDCHTRWILQLLDDPQNVTFSPRGGPASLTSGDDPAAAPGVRYTTSTTTITTSSLTRQINCTAPPSLQGKPLTSLSADDFRCPTSPVDRRRRNRNANEKRYKVGIIAASVTCFFLVSFALFVKFRKRIFSACRGQYRYKAYHSNGIKGGSPSAEIMVLEDTQFEDLDSDAEVTKVRV